jgi:hypothetical protein
MAVLPSRKSDQEISKSDYYPTIFLPKIRPKEDPNLLIGIQIRLVQKLNSNIRQIDFYLEIVHILGNLRNYSSNFLLYVKGRKCENPTFWTFCAKKADFSGKKRTNLEAFFQKRSAIKPRSDKADLLGSTAWAHHFGPWADHHGFKMSGFSFHKGVR